MTHGDQSAPPGDEGTPVGRRVVLGMLGLAGVGVILGSRLSSVISTIAEADPTGLTGLIPGGGRFRSYSVAGRVEEADPPGEYRLGRRGGVERDPQVVTFADLAAVPQTAHDQGRPVRHRMACPDVKWAGAAVRDPGPPREPTCGPPWGVRVRRRGLHRVAHARPGHAPRRAGRHLDAEEAISNNHGGPVRLYVAPMYFYKSLKWLERITLTERVEPRATGRNAGTTWTPGSDESNGTEPMTRSPELLNRFTLGQRWIHWTLAALMGVCMLTAAFLYVDPLSTLVGRRDVVATLHFAAGLALPVPLLVGADRLGRIPAATHGPGEPVQVRRTGRGCGPASAGHSRSASSTPGRARLPRSVLGAVLVSFGDRPDAALLRSVQ